MSKLEELAAAYRAAVEHEKAMEAKLHKMQAKVPFEYRSTYEFITGDLADAHVKVGRTAQTLLEFVCTS